jgi:hypothetical protein
MADEGSVATIEAPAADASLETTGVSTDSQVESSSSSDAAGGAETIDDADSPQKGETGHLRGSELYRTVKEKLKAAGLSPAEQRSIRNAIHIADKADKLSGGNLESIEQVQGLVGKLADDPDAGYTPEQIIESTLDERNFWRAFDEKFEKADLSIIPEMIQANPRSFQTLAPAVFDEYAKVNPEGFTGYIARSAKGFLDGKRIPLQWAIMETFLPSMPDFPGKDRMIGAIQEIYKAHQELDGMAKLPLEPKKVDGQPEASGGIDKREETIAAREMEVTRRDWNGNVSQIGVQLRNAEMDRIASAQKVTLDDADRQKIRAAVNEEYDARCAANPKYGQAMRGYLKAGNKQAYHDRAVSEYKKLIPSITARHTQAIIDQKKAAGSRPVQQNTNGNGKAAPALQNTNQKGVQWISGPLRTLGKQTDLRRTTHAMLERNEAYAVGGGDTIYKWKPKMA